MNPSEIIYELRELRKAWRKQSFSWTTEQKKEYDRLTQLRTERVRYFYDNGLVWKGPSTAGKTTVQDK